MGSTSQYEFKRPRFQFRLRTLLIATAVVALFVGALYAVLQHTSLQRRIANLQTERKQLRAEAGYFDVEDPEKVSVLLQKEHDPLTWRWRVWLPKGQWALYTATKEIPRLEMPKASGTLGNFAGGREIEVIVSARKDEKGDWRLKISADNSSAAWTLPKTHLVVAAHEDKDGRSQLSYTSGVGAVITLPPQKPVELVRYFEKPMGSTIDLYATKGPGVDGIMIWLQRKQP